MSNGWETARVTEVYRSYRRKKLDIGRGHLPRTEILSPRPSAFTLSTGLCRQLWRTTLSLRTAQNVAGHPRVLARHANRTVLTDVAKYRRAFMTVQRLSLATESCYTDSAMVRLRLQHEVMQL